MSHIYTDLAADLHEAGKGSRDNEKAPLLYTAINNENGVENVMHLSKELPSVTYTGAKELDIPKAPKRTIQLILLTVVLQSVGFTLVLPSMYLYLTSLHGDESFYGVVVAIYSVGSLLGSMLFGWWYDYRPVKEPILVAIFLAVGGNALYSSLGLFPLEYAPWLMFVSRFLVGFGSGSVAVCRAFCSEVTPIQNKTSMMAAISGAQGIGFVIGPGVGSGLSLLNYRYGDFHIDAYTSPGILSALFCFVNLVLVFFMLSGTEKRGKKSNVNYR
jgi:ceroid-lipofuscinosis MFS transporter 7